MNLQRYILHQDAWRKVEHDPSEQACMDHGIPPVWAEATQTGPAETAALASLMQMDGELIDFFRDTDASFVTTESEALFQLATRTARLEGAELCYSSLLISITPQGLVTAESKDSGIGVAVRERSVNGDGGPRDAWWVLALLLDELADSYLPVMEAVEDQALAMEDQLAEAPLMSQQLSKLFRMRRQLTLLKRIIDPVANLVSRLSQAERLPSTKRQPDFRPARDEFQRLESRVEGAWQVITSVVEMSNLLEQQRQGSASRQLAAWAAIVAVPTAIAGIFGMNFERLPWLNAQNGHWYALGTMALASSILFYRFKKIGWL